MITGAVAIFVKTPRLSPLKTRLAGGVGEAAAMEFYNLSLAATGAVIGESGLTGYWAVAEENGIHDPLWQSMERLWCGDGDLGARQHRIYSALFEKHDFAFLMGADTPQISPDILADAMKALESHDFVMGPAADGGYYLLGGRVPLDTEIWQGIPWSTDATCAALSARLPAKPFMLPVLTDVDEAEHLDAVVNEMPSKPNAAQSKLKNWITSR